MKLKDYKNEIKITLALALPVMIGQLGHIMIGVVDNVMVGRLGATALASVGLGIQLFSIIMVFCLGISIAVTPLVAEAVGAKKYPECGKILQQGIIVSTITGLIIIAVMLGVAEIIPLLKQPPEVIPDARAYLQILGFSVLPFMFFQTFRQYSEGLSFMWPAMVINIAANGLHIFMNWIFIYGNLGMPALGVKGAAYSSFVTRIVMAIAMITYIMKTQRYKPYLTRIFPIHLNWNIIKQIITIGLSSGLQYFFEVGAYTGAALIIGSIGANAFAGHQIALNVTSVTFMFTIGVSAAATVRVGQAKGEKNVEKMRRVGFSAIQLASIVMIFLGVLLVIGRNLIPLFFVNEAPVVRLASTLILIVALYQLSDGIQGSTLGALRGMADVKIPTILTFTSYWLIALPIGYLLAIPLKMGAAGMWIGLLIGLSASALFLFTRFYKKCTPSSL